MSTTLTAPSIDPALLSTRPSWDLGCLDLDEFLTAWESTRAFVAGALTRAGRTSDVDDVMSDLRDRAVSIAQNYDRRSGTPGQYFQGIARNIVRESARKHTPALELPDTLGPADLSGDPLEILLARDDCRRWSGYVHEFAGTADLNHLITAAMADPGLERPVPRRTRERVAAIARTTRAAMDLSDTRLTASFDDVASCVADARACRSVLPFLRKPASQHGYTALRGPRMSLATRHHENVTAAHELAISPSSARDRLQTARFLLSVSASVIEREGVGLSWQR